VPMRTRILWHASVLLAAALVGASCGGGDDTAGIPPPERLVATLGIITTEIRTALGGEDFADAVEGQQLGVGDRIRTDSTGFAELTYHDGSWQRVENEATLTVLALTRQDDASTVRSGVGTGRSWNRVRDLVSPEDAYELETPVGTATVRGTAFATECPTERRCTFTVTEGTVLITPIDAEPFELRAVSRVTVEVGTPPPPPEELTAAEALEDPWVARNVELDETRGAAPFPGGPSLDPDRDETALAEDAPCRTTGTVGELQLTDEPTVLTGEGVQLDPGTVAVARGFAVILEQPDPDTVRADLSVLVGYYEATPGGGGGIRTVNLSRSGADGEFRDWFASSGRPDHDITITGEPLVGARVTGTLYPSGELTADGLLPVDLTVTCTGAEADPPTTGTVPATPPDPGPATGPATAVVPDGPLNFSPGGG
jgi:hypothetical protein